MIPVNLVLQTRNRIIPRLQLVRLDVAAAAIVGIGRFGLGDDTDRVFLKDTIGCDAVVKNGAKDALDVVGECLAIVLADTLVTLQDLLLCDVRHRFRSNCF